MIYRLFVALLFTVVIFPFAAMYTFAAVYPDAHFAFDRQTWLHGLAPIAFGWVLFLLPGLLPFVGGRYYDWVAEKTGFAALFSATGNGLKRTRDGLKWLNLKGRTALANRPSTSEVAAKLRSGVKRIKDKGSTSAAPGDDRRDAISDTQTPDAAQGRTARSREKVAESLQKARGVINDAPKHVAKVKERIESLRQQLTPDELQRTIDLNQYTLDTFSHVKGIIAALVPFADLNEQDRAFCEAVVSAIPEPPSPSEADKPPPTYRFDYPEASREDLVRHAGRAEVLLKETDFDLAAQGDIERALRIVKAIVGHESRQKAVMLDPSGGDFVVGLPATNSA